MTATVRPGIAGGPRFAAHLRDRWPLPLQHGLAGHPLLSAAAIADLAECLGSASVIQEAGAKPVAYAESTREPVWAAAPGEAVRSLAERDSWLTLLNIERDERYRALVDELLDDLAQASGIAPRRWNRRMGFVFASSPHAVTGAHFDVEHSLQLQLQGTRLLSFGDFPDPQTREREVSRYWNGTYGRLDMSPAMTEEFVVEPGGGCYIPPYRPHWLRNGDGPSLSLTITFFNRDNDREFLANVLNERLRRRGLTPRPYGRFPVVDRTKVAVMRAAAITGRLRRSAAAE